LSKQYSGFDTTLASAHTNLIGLPETQTGVYEGACTIGIRDKVRFDSKVNAALKLGERQATVVLGQPLLTAKAQAKAVMAASPVPAISRLKTRNDCSDIFESPSAADWICEFSTAKSLGATTPTSRLLRFTTGKGGAWCSLISLATSATVSSS